MSTLGVKAQTDSTFHIAGSQGQLHCRIQMPEGTVRCPMVILSHGFGGDMTFHLWDPIAERLNAAGIGVVRYDFNGCGKSDGEFQNMTVPNEIEDLMAVIAWTRSQPRTLGISLVGHSQGGVVSGMAAGECGATQIDRLVLLSAAAVLREDALRGSSQGATFDPWHLDKPYYVVPGRGLKIGREYIQTAMNLPIYQTTAKYSGPALILNGMADVIVPYTYAELYHKVLKNSQLIIIPGEDHSYTVSPDYAVDLVTDWLIKELK
ncbi:MAG: alpha/beta hydrolase [Candidatus Amulumruptor caecigallinarius]|nr:alpha/beta hydrolase [Candidatus Amulumruptor caecigallinarius]MCM1396878.1 alpha/beta hydrolase [Candidatus Amulumruptor caecigallinarius]MCM1454178.1 alpha/beta hydrolase [bacterium]